MNDLINAIMYCLPTLRTLVPVLTALAMIKSYLQGSVLKHSKQIKSIQFSITFSKSLYMLEALTVLDIRTQKKKTWFSSCIII